MRSKKNKCFCPDSERLTCFLQLGYLNVFVF